MNLHEINLSKKLVRERSLIELFVHELVDT